MQLHTSGWSMKAQWPPLASLTMLRSVLCVWLDLTPPNFSFRTKIARSSPFLMVDGWSNRVIVESGHWEFELRLSVSHQLRSHCISELYVVRRWRIGIFAILLVNSSSTLFIIASISTWQDAYLQLSGCEDRQRQPELKASIMSFVCRTDSVVLSYENVHPCVIAIQKVVSWLCFAKSLVISSEILSLPPCWPTFI